MTTLTERDVLITVTAHHEDTSEAYGQLGNCMSKGQIRRLLEKAEDNQWHWCYVMVEAEYQDENGKEYTGFDTLGCCSYKSRLDFIKNSGYYEDMVQAALDMITTQLPKRKAKRIAEKTA